MLLAGLTAILVLAVLQVYHGLDDQRTAARLEAKRSATTTRAPRPATTAAATTAPPATAVPITPPTTAPTLLTVKAVSVIASRPTRALVDACKQQETFAAANLQDGDISTAWRVRGSGIGRAIILRLAAPTHLRQVGLVPGWAKVDGCNGTDFFRQNRTVSSVTWTFDHQVRVTQNFQDSATMQMLPVDVVTRTVTIRILATNPPAGSNTTPISEIRLAAQP